MKCLITLLLFVFAMFAAMLYFGASLFVVFAGVRDLLWPTVWLGFSFVALSIASAIAYYHGSAEAREPIDACLNEILSDEPIEIHDETVVDRLGIFLIRIVAIGAVIAGLWFPCRYAWANIRGVSLADRLVKNGTTLLGVTVRAYSYDWEPVTLANAGYGAENQDAPRVLEWKDDYVGTGAIAIGPLARDEEPLADAREFAQGLPYATFAETRSLRLRNGGLIELMTEGGLLEVAVLKSAGAKVVVYSLESRNHDTGRYARFRQNFDALVEGVALQPL